jgi:hypothetical protein
MIGGMVGKNTLESLFQRSADSEHNDREFSADNVVCCWIQSIRQQVDCFRKLLLMMLKGSKGINFLGATGEFIHANII